MSSLFNVNVNFRKLHGRLITGTFLVGMLVMTSSYKGTLISYLTARTEEAPINSVAELSKEISKVIAKLITIMYLSDTDNKQIHFLRTGNENRGHSVL